MNKLFACTDSHGALDKLLYALALAGIIDENNEWNCGKSKLVFCGDAIDRGPNSKGVIDLLLKLEKQAKKYGGEVVLLWGNHERMLYDGRKSDTWWECWLDNGGLACIASYSNILPKNSEGFIDYWDRQHAERIYKHHKEYFDSLKDFVIIDGIMFVHAGVIPYSNMDELTRGLQMCNNGKAHLWIREHFYNYPKDFLNNYNVKKIVFGHTPYTKYIAKINNVVMSPGEMLGGKLLGIDCGSYYPNGRVCVVEIMNDLTWRIAGSS